MQKNYRNKLDTIASELISASEKLYSLESSKIRGSISSNNELVKKTLQAKDELKKVIDKFDQYSKSAKDISTQDLQVVANYVNSLRHNI